MGCWGETVSKCAKGKERSPFIPLPAPPPPPGSFPTTPLHPEYPLTKS